MDLEVGIKKALLGLLILCSVYELSAQNFIRSNEWKKYRREVYVGIGAANFLGDLGGLNKIGTDYSIVDLELSQTGISTGIGYKYKILKWLNVVSCFKYLKVKGDDKLTLEKFRNNRNLNFKSNIFELSARFELVYMHNNVGNRYAIKRTFKQRKKTNSYDLSLFFGAGVFYFNPKGKDAVGVWHLLKPLHTEGQGLPNGAKQYKNYSVCIPLGVSYRYYIERQWSVGIEFSFMKTFTDYIDDVSTTYYDPQALKQAYGALSQKMADPNKGFIDGFSSPNADGSGAQRGDIEKDSYMSLQLTVGHLIKSKKYKRKKTRLRSRF
ncbi:MAG: hypothetical protein KBG47_06780 [Bacteroidia bacterium]|nr:hypothetical protein [Bacteroidia bacterium]